MIFTTVIDRVEKTLSIYSYAFLLCIIPSSPKFVVIVLVCTEVGVKTTQNIPIRHNGQKARPVLKDRYSSEVYLLLSEDHLGIFDQDIRPFGSSRYS